MPALSTGLAFLTAASTLSQYVGTRRAATGVTNQANFEASMLEQNALIAEYQAADAETRGKQEVSRARASTRQLIGAQRATIGAQGIALDSGSALDVQLEAADMGELDVLTLQNNAALEAWGYKVESSNYRNQAALTRYAGKNTAAGLRNQATSTLLTGALQTGMVLSNRVPKAPRGK